jgi:RNA polymerase sigma-70 factor (ECF subfamily)
VQFEACLQDDRKELEEELQKHEEFLFVRKQMMSLPLRYQEVISLRYFEGKSNREIAEILDINEGTIKSLLSRGLGRLREKCDVPGANDAGRGAIR